MEAVVQRKENDCLNNVFDSIAEQAKNMVNDPVNHPSHYADSKVECIDAMEQVFGAEAVKNFCLCNAFKYHWRHDQKNGEEDLRKAAWYMDKYKEIVNR